MEKTIIFAGGYEQIRENNTVKHLYYIQGPQGLAGVYVKQSGQTGDKLYYAEVDHLGSILRLTDNANKEVFAATYDAWGNRTVTNNTFDFHRGYTGHEHLPEFGLINMNGRMYDPALGRMLSPDNYVQSPLFSQSYNRYSYCVNNPLKWIDPTGEGIHDVNELPGVVVTAPYPSGGVGGFYPEVHLPRLPGFDMTYNYRAKGLVMQLPITELRRKMPTVISLLHIDPINNPTTLANPFASPPPPPPATDILVGTLTGQSTTENTTPWSVGWEWLTGTGPRDRTFYGGDYFTELLKQHYHIQNTRNMLINNFRNGNFSSDYNNYDLSGIQGVGKYLIDYSTLLTGGLTGNLAVTYLGSYDLKYDVLSGNSDPAIVQFTVTNSSTMASATRLPLVGYFPIWRNYIGPAINSFFETGPMSKTTQTFIWNETIYW